MLHNEPLCVEGVSIVATEQIADRNETIEGTGKDRPLRDDIRLLGRILGETVRERREEWSSISSNAFGKRRSASIATMTRRRGTGHPERSVARSDSADRTGVQLLLAPRQLALVCKLFGNLLSTLAVFEGPWLNQSKNVSVDRGVSLLRWISGGSNTSTIRRLTRLCRHQLSRIARVSLQRAKPASLILLSVLQNCLFRDMRVFRVLSLAELTAKEIASCRNA